jgi:hypothetical protein
MKPHALGEWLKGLLEEEGWLQTITDTLGPTWPWPKTDMYHWVSLLNRMDALLGSLVQNYSLSSESFQAAPFSLKDKQDLLAVLRLTWFLWENCTNRSLYSSYDVGSPLNYFTIFSFTF